MIGLLALLAACTGVKKEDTKTDASGQWKYVLETDGGATVTGYVVEPEGDLAIPSELDGHAVTGIGFQAFATCKGLTSVTIPDGVTRIGVWAFLACEGLTSVAIPDSVTSIGMGAFMNSGLTSVTIPGSATDIGTNPFNGCPLTFIDVSQNNPAYAHMDGVLFDNEQKMLVSFPSAREGAYTIPEGTLHIGDAAFGRCRNLTSITIPDSVTSIGNAAFMECSGLTSVMISDSVTSIGHSAFSGCSSLTSVMIPDSVTRIDADMLFMGSSVTHIDVASNNPVFEGIDGVLFDKQKRMLVSYPNAREGAYTIPQGTQSVGRAAFMACSGLISITIPDSVASIGDSAFLMCSGLISVTIPGSVMEIGRGAFQGSDEAIFNVKEGSLAEKYARDNGIPYVFIN